MALIKCIECGKMISDKSEFCIGCGCPIEVMLNDKLISEDNSLEEIEKLKIRANNGDAEAQWEMANYYWDENDNKKMKETVKWIMAAANNGHCIAQYILGCFYRLGDYLEQDNEESFKWFKLAAEQGYANAQYSVGSDYRFGIGTKKDIVQSLKWLKRAAENNNADAMLAIGDCYFSGEGVIESHKQAFVYWKKAADLEESYAMLRLGDCYRYGFAVEEDFEEAVKWYSLAVEYGNEDAQESLDELL